MRFIAGEDRHQLRMMHDCLDDFIIKDSAVRVLDFFIEELDLVRLGFKRTIPKAKGRKPYDPKVLLKLYLYGYMNGIRTGRKLEVETKRNLEVMWLLGKLSPDFKTICDFRKYNKKALKGVFREFTFICRKVNLIDFKLVAIDGSFFSAVNHNEKNYTLKKLQILLKKVDEKIDRYFDELDRTDMLELSDQKSLTEQIDILQQKRVEYEDLYRSLQVSKEKQKSLTDPDSRMMKKTNSKTDVSYNVQTAVDSKHKLIAEYDVTNDCNDKKQLSKMSHQIKDTHALTGLEVTADSGYSSGMEIEKCHAMNVTPFVPIPNIASKEKLGDYSKSVFQYLSDEDCYLCPANEKLYRSYREEKQRRTMYEKPSACKSCTFNSECCPSKRNYRRIGRYDNEAIYQRQRVMNLQYPEKLSARKCIVEHPFGTIKHSMNQAYFLTKGLASVNGEFALTACAYNFKRAINILGVAALMQAIREYYKGIRFILNSLLNMSKLIHFYAKMIILGRQKPRYGFIY